MSDARLIVIGISHYCEKARWALERAGIRYTEERHLQGFHHFYVRKAGGEWTTPTMILPDGQVLSQSSDIVEWADAQLPPDQRLYPPDIAGRIRTVEHWLDVTLGPDGRGWMYSHMLDRPEMIEKYGLAGIPDFERRTYRTAIHLLKPYLAARMRIQGTNPDLASLQGIYDEIAARIEDGRPYLFGDRFTAADLAFAALSAALILPRKYGVELPDVDELSDAMRIEVEAFREHPAGKFAQRIIDEQRPTPSWMAARASSPPTPEPVG